ncbi:hypothetical protein IW261DRAFT_1575730 [Armillaria novae-zelandiae]|uniref:Uncharacterized protein n=1 Tax=Armillaria novae-zelandiae TaxID=153914 RepID=A0AA39TLN1_9AGAR|nr:hypothetical protein IW261DRAFT_1575730 [Armillaria novae-zelandiae]
MADVEDVWNLDVYCEIIASKKRSDAFKFQCLTRCPRGRPNLKRRFLTEELLHPHHLFLCRSHLNPPFHRSFLGCHWTVPVCRNHPSSPIHQPRPPVDESAPNISPLPPTEHQAKALKYQIEIQREAIRVFSKVKDNVKALSDSITYLPQLDASTIDDHSLNENIERVEGFSTTFGNLWWQLSLTHDQKSFKSVRFLVQETTEELNACHDIIKKAREELSYEYNTRTQFNN